MMSEDMKQNKVIYPDASIIEQSEVYKDLGLQFADQLDLAWAEVKAK